MKVSDSERLSYEIMGVDDADLLFELDQDVEVMRYINGGNMTTMDEIHEVFLPRMAKYTDANKGLGLWKAETKDNDEFIGWILVRPLHFFASKPEWDNLELGWRFKRSSWGQGFGTEAARHIMQTLASTQQLVKFSALVLPENKGSIGIAKKLGMSFLKTELHKDPLGDEVVDYYEVSAH